MTSSTGRLRVVAATPVSEELISRVIRAEPRIDFVRDQDLLPPHRFPGDHSGDPSFSRTAEQQYAFDDLVDSAQALYGVPDENPAALTSTAAANPGLRWVHTMPAGGGAQVKAAGLTDAHLARVAFSTSAGVHAEPLAEFAVFGLMAGAKTLPRLLAQQRDTEWTGRWAMGPDQPATHPARRPGQHRPGDGTKLKALGATVSARAGRHRGRGSRRDRAPRPAGRRGRRRRRHRRDASGYRATEGLVSAEVFGAVKPGVTVVSVGRGTVIDEPAMTAAIADGRIGFAALDVFAAEPLASAAARCGAIRTCWSARTPRR